MIFDIFYDLVFHVESSIRFTETFNVKPQDMHKCIARCHVARNRFFHVLQREDCITQKYQENAQ